MSVVIQPYKSDQTTSKSFIFDPIQSYFQNFEELKQQEKWDEIILQGEEALGTVKAQGREFDEAKICAHLTSTAFYKGDLQQAILYSKQCRILSEKLKKPLLLIRALYLESACYRTLAAKQKTDNEQQNYYATAVELTLGAIKIYAENEFACDELKGKIYFNLGAANADNPKGNLHSASRNYLTALECYKNCSADQDILRTKLRLGKVYLLLKNYDAARASISEIRLLSKSARIGMHTDYLEAQLLLEEAEVNKCMEIAKRGLDAANALGAKEDAVRFIELIKQVEALDHNFEDWIKL